MSFSHSKQFEQENVVKGLRHYKHFYSCGCCLLVLSRKLLSYLFCCVWDLMS